MDRETLKGLLVEVIGEAMGLGEADVLERFRGGEIVVKPRNPEFASKSIPVDALFHKVVMIRDNLRVLEQKVNAHPKLDDTDRVQLQQYVTRCYGSLTTFNFLFRNPKDDGFGGGE